MHNKLGRVFDMNLFDPDDSSAMFNGGYVKSFEAHDGKEVSFIYRKIDPGTLLDLTNTSLLMPASGDKKSDAEELTQVEQLQIAQQRMHHRWEVLHKCIVAPQFENLKQIDRIPQEWQLVLYNLIMHGVLARDTSTVRRFR